MHGNPLDLSRTLDDAADANIAKNLSATANFPEGITAYFGLDRKDGRVRPTACWVRINTKLTNQQIEVLHAGTVPELDGLLARGWKSGIGVARDGGPSSTSAFKQSKDPSCDRGAAISYQFTTEKFDGRIGFSANEFGPECDLLAPLWGR